jgi:hypothetical protein
MSTQSGTIYSILDTSQLINLFKTNNISLLNSNVFLINNGFPLLFYEHLLELSKINSFERFSKNLCMLEAVNTFRTLKSNNSFPGSIFMLLEYEIFLYSKLGRVDIEILKEYILKDIVEYKLNIKINHHKYLYDKLRKEATKDALISVLPGNITNQNFMKKISLLEKNNIKIRPMNNIEVLTSVKRFMYRRIKNELEISKLVDTFRLSQDNKKREAKSALELAEYYSSQEINQNQTSEDVFYNNLFSELKRLTMVTYRIKDTDLVGLNYDDLILNRIFYHGYRYLANIYIKDIERKIESSDIYDIYFMCCSVIFKVFVDKRTFDLGERMKKELEIDLNLERNIKEL